MISENRLKPRVPCAGISTVARVLMTEVIPCSPSTRHWSLGALPGCGDKIVNDCGKCPELAGTRFAFHPSIRARSERGGDHQPRERVGVGAQPLGRFVSTMTISAGRRLWHDALHRAHECCDERVAEREASAAQRSHDARGYQLRARRAAPCAKRRPLFSLHKRRRKLRTRRDERARVRPGSLRRDGIHRQIGGRVPR